MRGKGEAGWRSGWEEVDEKGWQGGEADRGGERERRLAEGVGREEKVRWAMGRKVCRLHRPPAIPGELVRPKYYPHH